MSERPIPSLSREEAQGRSDYPKVRRLCKSMRADCEELLETYGVRIEDWFVRLSLPFTWWCFLQEEVPLRPIRTLPKRLVDNIDSRLLVVPMKTRHGSKNVVIHSEGANPAIARWIDLRVTPSTRFLRFYGNNAHVLCLPDDPAYEASVWKTGFTDHFSQGGSTKYNLKIGDIGLVGYQEARRYSKLLGALNSLPDISIGETLAAKTYIETGERVYRNY